MKKVLPLLILALITAVSLSAQSRLEVPRFKLYKTQNMWTFLKLDTSNGLIWQVQYGLNDNERLEAGINSKKLVIENNAPAGRFELYPTDNMFNFILIDTKVGTTYQVQWSINADERGMIPISKSTT